MSTPRQRIETFIAWSLAVLIVASAFVIGSVFIRHPFPTFRSGEAIVVVGVGFTVCVLWILLAAVICGAVITGRIRRWWLLFLILTVLGFFVVMPWPFRYVSDIEVRLSDQASRTF